MTEFEITLEKTARLLDEILDTIDSINANLQKGKAALEKAIDDAQSDDVFCPICGQEHNADNEYNAGYCQHCKEPVIDYSTGEFMI